jgi:hypothetical protein
MGVFLLFMGLLGAIWPYKMAKFGEQLDSIGSKRSWYSVEPADWNVTLTRGLGILFSIFGIIILVVNL